MQPRASIRPTNAKVAPGSQRNAPSTNRHSSQYATVKPALPSNRMRRRPRRSAARPQGRASSTQTTPDTVTAAPACQVAMPSSRAMGPIKATNAIIAMVQAMLASSNGRVSSVLAVVKGAGSFATFIGQSRAVEQTACRSMRHSALRASPCTACRQSLRRSGPGHMLRNTPSRRTSACISAAPRCTSTVANNR
ncbi:hypothetical protein D3C78_340320 [compost metagenome]